jgi:hypothetical protein
MFLLGWDSEISRNGKGLHSKKKIGKFREFFNPNSPKWENTFDNIVFFGVLLRRYFSYFNEENVFPLLQE